MSDAEKCRRCGKTGHKARTCKVPFGKAWPGEPAVKMKVRWPDGSYIETEGWIPPEMLDAALEFQASLWKREEPTTASTTPNR